MFCRYFPKNTGLWSGESHYISVTTVFLTTQQTDSSSVSTHNITAFYSCPSLHSKSSHHQSPELNNLFLLTYHYVTCI